MTCHGDFDNSCRPSNAQNTLTCLVCLGRLPLTLWQLHMRLRSGSCGWRTQNISERNEQRQHPSDFRSRLFVFRPRCPMQILPRVQYGSGLQLKSGLHARS